MVAESNCKPEVRKENLSRIVKLLSWLRRYSQIVYESVSKAALRETDYRTYCRSTGTNWSQDPEDPVCKKVVPYMLDTKRLNLDQNVIKDGSRGTERHW